MKKLKSWLQNLCSKEAASIVFVESVVFFSYLRMFWGFFQQDEWLSFAYRFLASKGGLIGIFNDSFTPSVGHYQPLTALVLNLLVLIFKLHYFPYAAVSIILHLINVYLLYRFAKNYFKEIKAAVIVSLIFGVSAATFQATSWVLADIGVHFSTLFAILSVNELLNFSRSSSKTAFRKTIIFLIISLLFKEISIGLFAFIPLAILFSKKISNKKIYIFKALIIATIYIVLRVGMVFLPISYSREKLVTQSQPVKNIAYNFITLLVKGLTQSIVAPRLLVTEAYLAAKFLPERLTGEVNTSGYDLFVENKVLEVVTFLNFATIAGLLFLLLKKSQSPNLVRAALAGALFVFVSSPIFALAPERSGRIFLIDSRNLYLLSLGSSFVVYSVVCALFLERKRLSIFTFLAFIAFNVHGLNKELFEVSQNGVVRKNILQRINNDYPTLSPKVIFYTESDTSLYGLPTEERILPFQSGFGQSLLVWYFSKEKMPSEFLKERFLWEITDQGYKEFKDRGFGYLRSFDELAKVVSSKNIKVSSVVSYRYDSKTGVLTNNSEEIRGRLLGYLSKKIELDRSGWKVYPSLNQGGVLSMIDGKMATFWDSITPYSPNQKITVDLGRNRTISLVEIDSNENKDQNMIGYKVSLSPDGIDWKEVFYSKVYPPGADGVNRLYFKPQSARFVEIKQIGAHEVASWVIHELNIYEAKTN